MPLQTSVPLLPGTPTTLGWDQQLFGQTTHCTTAQGQPSLHCPAYHCYTTPTPPSCPFCPFPFHPISRCITLPALLPYTPCLHGETVTIAWRRPLPNLQLLLYAGSLLCSRSRVTGGLWVYHTHHLPPHCRWRPVLIIPPHGRQALHAHPRQPFPPPPPQAEGSPLLPSCQRTHLHPPPPTTPTTPTPHPPTYRVVTCRTQGRTVGRRRAGQRDRILQQPLFIALAWILDASSIPHCACTARALYRTSSPVQTGHDGYNVGWNVPHHHYTLPHAHRALPHTAPTTTPPHHYHRRTCCRCVGVRDVRTCAAPRLSINATTPCCLTVWFAAYLHASQPHLLGVGGREVSSRIARDSIPPAALKERDRR